MKAIVLAQPGRFERTDREPLRPGTDEALVRVRRVGICGTDLHAFRGDQPYFTYPRVLGHELGVEIVEAGPNEAGLKVGDRCAVEPYLNCGSCIACRRGKTNCCASLRVLGVHTDGGLQEYIPVPIAKLHRAETLTLDQLALVETLGIGAHATARAQVEAGEFALVLGAGPIGLAVTQFLMVACARTLVADVNPRRLDFCRAQMGVAFALNARESLREQVAEITSGDMPTVAFDSTGHPESMRQAFDLTAHGGRLVFVSLVQADIPVHDPDFHRRETTLLATRNATGADFRRVLAQMESGAIDTTPWITHRASGEEMIGRFPDWLNPDSGVVKAIVEFG